MSNTDFCSDALLDYLYTQTLPTPLPPDYTKDDLKKALVFQMGRNYWPPDSLWPVFVHFRP